MGTNLRAFALATLDTEIAAAQAKLDELKFAKTTLQAMTEVQISALSTIPSLYQQLALESTKQKALSKGQAKKSG
jgi:hypothetical protein